MQDKRALPIEQLRLTSDAYKALKNAKIATVQDILDTEADKGLIRVRNLGRASYDVIALALREIGVALNERVDMLHNAATDAIIQRRSTRAYLDKPVGHVELEALLRAGNAAPYTEGYRHFSVIEDKALIDRINSEAKAAAVAMAMPGLMELGRDETFHCLYNAPSVMLISVSESGPAPEYDASAAAENVLIAAQSLGIASCWIFFATVAFYPSSGEALKQELKIPEGFKPYVAISLGYADESKWEAREEKPVSATWL